MLQQVKVEVKVKRAKGERLEVRGQSSKHSVLQQVKVEVKVKQISAEVVQSKPKHRGVGKHALDFFLSRSGNIPST